MGSLGPIPKRRYRCLSRSPTRQNKGGWVKFEPMSDEFEGKELDRNKWVVGMAWWKGRQPALFSEKNVTVSDGKLHLTMRKEKLPPRLEKHGYHDYTSAALHSKARSSYGYYEVKAKPMNSGGSSSFWFHKGGTPGWHGDRRVRDRRQGQGLRAQVQHDRPRLRDAARRRSIGRWAGPGSPLGGWPTITTSTDSIGARTN